MGALLYTLLDTLLDILSDTLFGTLYCASESHGVTPEGGVAHAVRRCSIGQVSRAAKAEIMWCASMWWRVRKGVASTVGYEAAAAIGL